MTGGPDARTAAFRWGDPDRLPPSRFDFTAPLPALTDLGRVHLVAIGGIGMSGVARLLLEAGVPVSGSDQRGSAVLDGLRAAGAAVTIGHDAALVEDVDTVVVSSAIPEANVELARARQLDLRVLHRAQALQCVVAERAVIAVAGANGKTSTTSFIAWALTELGFDPTYAIGGELLGASNARLGAGPLAVIEADESDQSFLAYTPRVPVVTSVQADHLDHYGDLASIEAAYRCFLGRSTGAVTVINADDVGSRALADDTATHGMDVRGYGHAFDADLRITDVDLRPDGSSARLAVPGRAEELTLRLRVPGLRNVENAVAAYGAIRCAVDAVEGASAATDDQILGALGAFRGTGRRFERKGSASGVTVVDDYAHNPAKVASVIETGRAVVGDTGRLVVVFQPHLYSRTRDFQREFGEALARADLVLVTDVYGAREQPMDGVTGELVVDAARAAGARDVRWVPDLADVARATADAARSGDLVITVGAGDVTTVGPRLLELLAGTRGDT